MVYKNHIDSATTNILCFLKPVWAVAKFTYFGPQKLDQSAMHFDFRPSLAEKMWQCFVDGFKVAKTHPNSLCNTFNLSVRFIAVEADSHLTASMIIDHHQHVQPL